jgi:hypothetical protein
MLKKNYQLEASINQTKLMLDSNVRELRAVMETILNLYNFKSGKKYKMNSFLRMLVG